jgi:hypothetical protein
MVTPMQCPICGGALAEGRPIDVCVACHKSLAGGVAVRATGEFLAPSLAAISAAEAAEPLAHSGNACAWCGKAEPEVKKLLGRAGVAFCNECVALCVDILDAELGTWRA